MTHALVHGPHSQSGHLRLHERPDPARIVGYSGAIAINAAALMLLLLPMAVPEPLPLPDPEPPVIWIETVKPRPVVEVPVVRPQPPRAQPTLRRADIPPVPPVVFPDSTPMDAAAADIPPADAAAGDRFTPPHPLPAVRLEYDRASPPPYPREALRDGLQGTVLLRVLVDTDGRPLEVTVERGSGHRILDDAARRHVLRRWAFRPAIRDGVAVQAVGLVPIDFKL